MRPNLLIYVIGRTFLLCHGSKGYITGNNKTCQISISTYYLKNGYNRSDNFIRHCFASSSSIQNARLILPMQPACLITWCLFCLQ